MREAQVAFPSYAQYSTEALIDAFARGPDQLRLSVSGLAERELRARPRGELRWSVHEIILHTLDSEIQGAYRIRKVWAEPGSILPGYDQDVWAREHEYAGTVGDREGAINGLAALRAATLPVFRRAIAGDWKKSGLHPDYGPLTLRNLLELYADHVERHVAQILESRVLMGRGIELELLLPERLY